MSFIARRFMPQSRLIAGVAALACVFAMGLALTTATSRADVGLPSCVTVIRDYPVTGAKNNCAFKLGVRFNYAFSSSDCKILAPGQKALESNWDYFVNATRCA